MDSPKLRHEITSQGFEWTFPLPYSYSSLESYFQLSDLFPFYDRLFTLLF